MKGLPLPFLAVLAAAISATIGGSAVVATRLAVPESNALTVTFLRFLGASLVMLAFTLPRTKIRADWHDLPPVAALGLIQFARFAWFFSASLQYIPAARGACRDHRRHHAGELECADERIAQPALKPVSSDWDPCPSSGSAP